MSPVLSIGNCCLGSLDLDIKMDRPKGVGRFKLKREGRERDGGCEREGGGEKEEDRVCVCVCEREREKRGEKKRVCERKRIREKSRMCLKARDRERGERACVRGRKREK